MSYFDSSLLAKFYLEKPESDAVRSLAEFIGGVHCVAFGRLEVASAFHRKWREGAFFDAAFREVSDQFADDCAAGLWQWLPASATLVEAAAAAMRRLPKTVFLRSADALHLTGARENGFDAIYSTDRHVLAAAPHFKLKGQALPAR